MSAAQKGSRPWCYPHMVRVSKVKVSRNVYMAVHMWVYRHFGKAKRCEMPECKGTCVKFEWDNISGEYKRERSDWREVCRSCHCKLDNLIGNIFSEKTQTVDNSFDKFLYGGKVNR